jgi:uncharacterized protein (TIGR02145 family)
MKKLLLFGALIISSNLSAQTPGGGVTDIDGNTYETVVIGTQEWMASNLRVSRYNNGDSILFEPNLANWNSLSVGAFTWHSNDQNYDLTYGKLYNWFTVSDSRGVCPTGWHIPETNEFSELFTTLGGTGVAGGAMKDTIPGYWNAPNTGANNSSGFNALPGAGVNSPLSIFGPLGENAQWWTSSETISDPSKADRIIIYYNMASALYDNAPKPVGLSLRCLQNNGGGVGLIELNDEPKSLVKIIDFMGRETEFKPNTPLIYIYSDGSTERVMKLEE